MNYWHLQMSKGLQSEEEFSTDEIRDIISNNNIIGTGEWRDNKSDQCKQFKEAIEVGDIVFVRNGIEPIALVEIIEKNIASQFYDNEHRVKLLSLYDNQIEQKIGSYNGQLQGTLTRVANQTNSTGKFIIDWYSQIKKLEKMNLALNVLEYKKQIILQGPPGTGKTRLAKEIANSLCKPKTITNTDIQNTLNLGLHISTPTNYNTFELTLITNDLVKVQPKNAQNDYTVSFADIITSYNEKQWESPVSANNTSGNASYKIGMAKYIFDNIKQDNCKLIQFHPAYSYEDFVRGITAKSNGTQVEYETENKVLAKFATAALKNYTNSKQSVTALSKEKWLSSEIELFAEKVQEEIDLNGKYSINDTVSIFGVEEDAFRYKGNNWDVQSLQRMKFRDISLSYLANANNRQDIKQIQGISGRAKEHSSYDFKLLEKFREFLTTRPVYTATSIDIPLKNYVLIIDEINRANLPAVLGELIYALEYRGEVVESMYAIDDDNTLILPPNLYIIGTMNTADRSVGHIDYAIRRRFAFVDVLPTNEPIKDFAKPTFEKVSKLFIKNYDTIDWSNPMLEKSDHLAADFKPEEVWLGHSYFITKEKDENGLSEELQLSTKLKFEVVPILKEYVKDGILLDTVEVKNIINGLS